MPEIFISYRREDSAGHAGRLFDAMRDRFGEESVFMDVTDIEAGADFTQALDGALLSCRVVLVVIGTQWLSVLDGAGQRRLDDPRDHVRLEIVRALARAAHVIPVLVRGAHMPSSPDLPEDLEPLARRQAHDLSDSRWTYDTGRLLDVVARDLGLSQAIEDPPTAPSGPRNGGPASRLARVRGLAVGAVAVGLMIFMGIVKTRDWFAGGAPVDRSIAGDSKATRGLPLGVVPQTPLTIELQARPETTLAPAGEARAGFTVYTVLGGTLRRQTDITETLRLFMRITNVDTGNPLVLTPESFRLIVDQQAIAPTEAPIAAVAVQSAFAGWVSFSLPSPASAVVLQVGDVHRQTASIPIDLQPAGREVRAVSPRSWRYPIDIVITAQRQIGPMIIRVNGARVEHFADAIPPVQPEQLLLTFRVRFMNVGSPYGAVANGNDFRLVVDGIPWAPQSAPVELLKEQTTADHEVAFVMPGTASKIFLQLGTAAQHADAIPVDLVMARVTKVP